MAVRIAIEYHIAALPRTPFCHYVAFHPQGSVSLDSRVASLPYESSSLATSRGNKKFEEKNRESYTSCTTPAIPLWWLVPPPFRPVGKRVTGFSVAYGSLRIQFPCHRKRGHYKAPLCCELFMKGLLFRALLSHRSAGGKWCRKAPKGGKATGGG